MGREIRDAELIEGIRAGGTTRARTILLLYRQYLDLARRRSRRYRIDDEEAGDAYTDAVLTVVEHIAGQRYRGEASIKTYLSRIFRNKCVDRHRKNTTVSVVWTDVFPNLADGDFLEEMMARERLATLHGYLDQVGERCKTLLLLSGQGYSPEEIAREMGFSSPHSASSQRYKCLEKLKSLLGAAGI
ncbi:MAG: hypothetical protein OHK0039_36910 [Bacteroidia bacterium]